MREAVAWKQKGTHLTGELDAVNPHGEVALGIKVEILKESMVSLLKEVETLKETARQIEIFRKVVAGIEEGVDFYAEVRRFEIDLIRRALEQTNGHQSRAARLLGLKTTTLNEMVKRYGLQPTSPSHMASRETSVENAQPEAEEKNNAESRKLRPMAERKVG